MASEAPGATASGTAPNLAPPSHGESHKRQGVFVLALGSIGVVFGDIGTSPLYAFKEALAQAADDGVTRPEILGVVSLALWALILVVTVKYVLFIMRADNKGEGGVLSLMALAQRAIGKRTTLVFVLGALGAALFYGDAIITPAMSVLSAVEGLRTIPALENRVTGQIVLIIATIMLLGLFFIQSRAPPRWRCSSGRSAPSGSRRCSGSAPGTWSAIPTSCWPSTPTMRRSS